MTTQALPPSASDLRTNFRAAALALPFGIAGVFASVAFVDNIPAKVDGLVFAGALAAFAATQMTISAYKLKKSGLIIFRP